MSSLSVRSILALALILAFAGCIPSAPPQEPAPARPETPIERPTARQEGERVAPALPPTTDASMSDPADEKPHLSVPLDRESAALGIPMPTVSLVPMADKIGYQLQAMFPVDGLDMEGTLTYTAPNTWRLAGQFISDTEAFRPGRPELANMGHLESKKEGGLEHIPDNTEIVINFAAPLPPPDAPKAASPITTPFELEIKASKNVHFLMFLMPF